MICYALLSNKVVCRVAVLLAMVLISACGSKNIYESKAPVGFKIDGKSNDWPQLTSYNASSKLLYGVFNNERDLYVVFSASDPVTQRKIMLNGLTTWINGKGKKKKTSGLKYPLITLLPDDLISPDRTRKGESGGMRKRIKNVGREAELMGMAGGEDTFINLDRVSIDIEAAIGYDDASQSLIYEMKIPLVLVDVSKEQIAIGFETTKSAVPAMVKRDAMAMRTGSGNRGGMRGGRGMPGRSGPGSDKQHSIEPLSMWIKIELRQ